MSLVDTAPTAVIAEDEPVLRLDLRQALSRLWPELQICADVEDGFEALRALLRQGADVRGYCAWSLLDNLEWAHGFSKRFGLVHVDFQTLARTPKASALYYRRVIASHGGVLDEPVVPD